MSTELTRNGFLKLAGVSMGTAVAATASIAAADEVATCAYDQTVVWDGAYDVVVVGAGIAGMTAAISAMNEGASVLLVDKAPEDEAGGNSRVCHQLYGTVNDVEKGMEYYSAMRGDFMSTSDEVLRVYVEGMAANDDWVISIGADPDQITSWARCGISSYETEHPELPGGEAYEGHSVVPELVNGALFNLNLDYIKAHADKIDMWFEAPGVELVQDPETKTVLGVVIETGGERLNIKAENGVCLTCGGFENNPAMIECYLGLGGNTAFYGSKYNTGDGITMGIACGSDLWHMHNYETAGVAGNVYAVDAAYILMLNEMTVAPSILVGPDGTRYTRESVHPTAMRHGHVYVAGDWTFPAYVEGSWSIVDQAGVDATNTQDIMDDGIANGQVVKADTLAELAELTGMTYLEDTVAIYNRYCADGLDEAFRRDPATLLPFGDGPYYAIKMNVRGILNTQGGPVRSAQAEVVDVWGEPIPHLYSAGELGGVTAHDYQGGGNIAECLVFGRIAGKNAAQPKEPLAAHGCVPVESPLTYVPGVRNDLV